MNNNSLSPDEQSFFGSLSVQKPEVTPQGEIKNIYLSPDEASFFSSLPEIQVKDNSFIGSLKKQFQAFTEGQNEILRGAIKGLVEFGEIIGSSGERITPQQKEQRIETLKELLPSEETEMTESRERFGELLPSALAGPGGIGQALVRTAIATEGGKIGEALGGNVGKTIGEVLPYIAPNPTKYLQAANSNQKKLLDFGRKMGLNEKQLTIATKPDTGINEKLAAFSIKRGPAQARIKQTKEGMDSIYKRLESLPESNTPLSVDQLPEFMQNLETQMQKLSHSERQQILPDVLDFWKSKRTGADLMNLHQDINKTIMDSGKAQYGLLKEPISIALGELSPSLATDFQLANNLYANFARVRGQMAPGLVDDLLTGIKALSAASALVVGNYPALQSMVGVAAARSAATALMISPRLQNLQYKMLDAVNKNKISIANQIFDLFKEEIKQDAPEYYQLVKDQSFVARPQEHQSKSSNKTK